MIYIASDHGGFKLKEEVKKTLGKLKVDFTDLGPYEYVPDDDYPDYAAKVAARVSRNPKKDAGILLCRSGQGVNIVANKFRNVRSALVWNVKEAKASRTDDLANVLSLPSDYITAAAAAPIVRAWLATPTGTAARHVKRIHKISRLERRKSETRNTKYERSL